MILHEITKKLSLTANIFGPPVNVYSFLGAFSGVRRNCGAEALAVATHVTAARIRGAKVVPFLDWHN